MAHSPPDWSAFRLALLRVTYRPAAPLVFQQYPGIVLRGALGAALRRVSCFDEEACSRACAYPHRCAYGRLFESAVPPGSPVFADQPDAARPFVVEAGGQWRMEEEGGKGERAGAGTAAVYAPDPTFAFHLLLIGQAIDYLPYFVYALEQAGQQGFWSDEPADRQGEPRARPRRRVRCALERVESLARRGDPQPALIYSGQDRRLLDDVRILSGDDVCRRPPDPAPAQITLRFLTPAQLKHRGKVVHRPDLEVIVRALLRRLVALAWFHCGLPLDLDFKGLVGQARAATVVRSDLQPARITRYSRRQGQSVWLGGCQGSIAFEAVAADLLPLLALGEYVHVGRGAVYGMGRMVVE